MNLSAKLTQEIPVGRMKTPLSCNGFQIFWEIVDSTSQEPVDPSGISFVLAVELPNGSLIPFDVNPPGNAYQIEPSACGGGVTVKVTASGLSATEEAKIYMIGLF
ncbi:MAG: hypothetical protein ACRCTP_04235 [Aeromonas popoffii]|uniref:hypothetical protein n=1 Tax=Aeromonas popoffii TaxID=70856 RepID=UPI003F2A6EA3